MVQITKQLIFVTLIVAPAISAPTGNHWRDASGSADMVAREPIRPKPRPPRRNTLVPILPMPAGAIAADFPTMPPPTPRRRATLVSILPEPIGYPDVGVTPGFLHRPKGIPHENSESVTGVGAATSSSTSPNPSRKHHLFDDDSPSNALSDTHFSSPRGKRQRSLASSRGQMTLERAEQHQGASTGVPNERPEAVSLSERAANTHN